MSYVSDDSLAALPALRGWFEAAHHLMARYRPEHDQPQDFERWLLNESLHELRRQLGQHST